MLSQFRPSEETRLSMVGGSPTETRAATSRAERDKRINYIILIDPFVAERRSAAAEFHCPLAALVVDHNCQNYCFDVSE
jgi:hypothetical protein